MRARFLAAALATATLAGTPLAADEVVLRTGRSLKGTAFRGPIETRVNPYRCSLPEMTWGVVAVPNAEVKEVRPEEDPATLHGALDGLAAADVPGRLALLARARKAGDRLLSRRLAEEVLREAPEHPEALRVVGGAAAAVERRRGDLFLDPSLAAAVRRLIRLPSGEERRGEAERLVREHGLTAPPAMLERLARSLDAERGERHDVRLTVEAETHPGATYSIFVPSDLDPLLARPLLLALHGGSVPGSRATAVLGTGREVLPLFVEGARRARAILVCPTALEAPWATPRNEAFLLALLAEVAALWNVDLDRVHVAGEGTGADAALWFASRHPEAFATAGAASSTTPAAATSVASRGVGVWLHHGEQDEVVPVGDSRKVAIRLAQGAADFAYCELPGLGHGFPPAAERDFWRFATPRRRTRRKSAWPRASFAEAASRGEVEAFGEPDGAWGTRLRGDETPEELLGILRRGLSSSEPAARRLAQAPAAEVGPAAADLVKRRDVPANGRAWAAWLCGRLRPPEAVAAVGGVVRAEKDAFLLRHAAAALREIGSEDSVGDLRSALADAAARHKRSGGKSVPFSEHERACRLVADLVEALGTVGTSPDLAADVEAAAVIGILRDARTVEGPAEPGEDVGAPRARLARACARAYRALGAEPTLYDMLRTVLRGDKASLEAAARGAAEGLPKPAPGGR